jgi:hypothetical protein
MVRMVRVVRMVRLFQKMKFLINFLLDKFYKRCLTRSSFSCNEETLVCFLHQVKCHLLFFVVLIELEILLHHVVVFWFLGAKLQPSCEVILHNKNYFR